MMHDRKCIARYGHVDMNNRALVGEKYDDDIVKMQEL